MIKLYFRPFIPNLLHKKNSIYEKWIFTIESAECHRKIFSFAKGFLYIFLFELSCHVCISKLTQRVAHELIGQGPKSITRSKIYFDELFFGIRRSKKVYQDIPYIKIFPFVMKLKESQKFLLRKTNIHRSLTLIYYHHILIIDIEKFPKCLAWYQHLFRIYYHIIKISPLGDIIE